SERIERAWLDELRLPGPKPSTLRLEFTDGLAGLKAITVAVSPDNVDVTLTPDGPERMAEYAAAAQGLADRLQARFPGRTIRILEAQLPAGNEPSGGFDDLSRLFQRSDRTS
ncbi:MAG: hypothetical protein H7Y08_04755, partial [Rhizobiaceae bacterium]|nr:hypothetical protein [Rhizobiaceae bacterium]